MTMPGFTAEASLYKTRGHYRTGQHTLNPSAQRVGPIWPAAREQEGEIINVHGCPPGSIAVGEQPNITCVFIPPAGTGEAGEDLPPGGRPDDDGPRSTKYPNRGNPVASWRCAKTNPIFKWKDNPAAVRCDKKVDDVPGQAPIFHYVFCREKGSVDGKFPKKNELFCCGYNRATDTFENCDPI